MKMLRTNFIEEKGVYAPPVCKLLNVHVQGVLCQSFGPANAPGLPLSEDPGYTYTY